MSVTIRGTDTSAAAPSFTGSDGDSGLFFPAANQVAIATNGTVALTVDAAQNIGVGVTNPNLYGKFVVFGSSGPTSIMTETAAFLSGGSNGLRIGTDGTDVLMGVGNSGTTLTLCARAGGVYSKALNINSSGYVTQPFQPMFVANGNQNTYVSIANGANVPLNTTKLNTSSSYNTSTYVFTAPVAGRYLFIMAFYMQGGPNSALFDFWYNSTSYQRMYWQVPASDSSYFGQCIVSMSAGDTMTIRNNTGAARSAFIASDLHTAFSGYLIG
jgi:hypothetical protein